MKNYSRQLGEILAQAYFLGGSPCSGKSTIAKTLATQYELDYYNVDDHYPDHVNRCDPHKHPTMYKITRMSWDKIWMRPVEFQVQHYSQRAFIQDILKECSEPEKAFENWMQRDHLFGQEILRQAAEFGYRALLVDGEKSLDELYEQLCQHLGFA